MKLSTATLATAVFLTLSGCQDNKPASDAGNSVTAIEGTEAAADRSMREAEAAIDAQADAIAAANESTNEADTVAGINEQ